MCVALVCGTGALAVVGDGRTDRPTNQAVRLGGSCGTADFDSDVDVDLVDLGALQRCFTGNPGVGDPLYQCLFDFDTNGTIDLADFDAYAGLFLGPPVEFTLIDKLQSSDAVAQQQFGQTVAVDGEYSMIGVPRSGVGGAVYVYKFIAGAWVEQQILVASDAEQFDRFGQAVSIDALCTGPPYATHCRSTTSPVEGLPLSSIAPMDPLPS